VGEARFRFLSQEDVVAAGGLDVGATIDVVEEALRLHAEDDTRLPSKSALLWSDELGSEETDGRIMAMPAYVGGSIALAGLKWIPSVPSNPSRGLPRGIGLIVLTHRETGLPVAVMDGTIVSAARTGAVTGITARRLARPGARVAAILGAGVQARTQLAALEAVLPGLDEVRVWDIAPERAQAFRERSDAVVPAPSAEAACRGADVIVAAMIAPEPYVGRPSGSGRGACSARFPRWTPRSPASSARTSSSATCGTTRPVTTRDRSRGRWPRASSRARTWSSCPSWSRGAIRAEPRTTSGSSRRP
jgi:ornithine cyclodeaminase/alanine dehydrogenase-like protein (mu-crystallin family)